MKYVFALLASLATAIILFVIRDYGRRFINIGDFPLNTSFLIGWFACIVYKATIEYFDYKSFEREFRKK